MPALAPARERHPIYFDCRTNPVESFRDADPGLSCGGTAINQLGSRPASPFRTSFFAA
jgi:hypothetical protein